MSPASCRCPEDCLAHAIEQPGAKPWHGPRFRGTIVRVAHALGRETSPGAFEPSYLDHVDAIRERDGATIATYRGAVIETSNTEDTTRILAALDKKRADRERETQLDEQSRLARRAS